MSLYQYAVIATAALLPTYLVRFTVFGIPTNFLEILIVLCLILTAVEFKGEVINNLKFIWTPLVGISLFIVAAALSVIISPHLYTSLGILKGWIILPVLFGGCVFVAGIDKKVRGYIIQALLLSGTVMALFSISQLGSLDRVRGVYDVPNSLALFLAPLIVLAVYSDNRLNKYMAIVMGMALIATQSVSGLIAVLTVLFLGVLLDNKRQDKSRYIVGLLVIILFCASYLFMSDRLSYLVQPLITDGEVNSISVRQQLWSVSWDLIKENPVLGVGLGVFEPHYQSYLHQRFQVYEVNKDMSSPLPEFVFRDPHNWVLSFWLNTGLLGLMSFMWINLWVLKYAYLYRHTLKSEVIPVGLSLISILVFGLTDTVYWKNDLAAIYWVIFSLLLLSIWSRRCRFN